MQYIILLCHDTGIPNMAKHSYCQVLKAELWGFAERHVEQCVEGVHSWGWFLLHLEGASWRVFASPMQSPQGNCISLPLEVGDDTCPLSLQVSHLSHLIFLTVSVYKTEHSHSYDCFVSEKRVCTFAPVLVFSASEVARRTTSGWMSFFRVVRRSKCHSSGFE